MFVKVFGLRIRESMMVAAAQYQNRAGSMGLIVNLEWMLVVSNQHVQAFTEQLDPYKKISTGTTHMG